MDTITWDDLPGWRQDNEYITSGYRPSSGSFRKCLGSLNYLHNETVNIYSHLLGAILFLGLFLYVLWKISHYNNTIRHIECIVFIAFFIGIITCFFLSAVFHTIANHSEIVSKRGVQLDYLGIVLLIWGAIIPSVYYGFYCDPNLQKAYWIAISSVAFGCVLVTLVPKFQSSKLRLYRAVLYTTLSVSTTVPIFHGIGIHGWEIQNQRIGFTYVFLTAGLNLIAVVIFSVRYPERWRLTRFDIYGQSHQLLHIMVVFAGLIYLVGLLGAAGFAYSLRGQCTQISQLNKGGVF